MNQSACYTPRTPSSPSAVQPNKLRSHYASLQEAFKNPPAAQVFANNQYLALIIHLDFRRREQSRELGGFKAQLSRTHRQDAFKKILQICVRMAQLPISEVEKTSVILSVEYNIYL